jgi:hypothetical protein
MTHTSAARENTAIAKAVIQVDEGERCGAVALAIAGVFLVEVF